MTAARHPTGPGPLRPPLRPGFEFKLINVPLDDLTTLNDAGRQGWHCVAVLDMSGQSITFTALVERPAAAIGSGD